MVKANHVPMTIDVALAAGLNPIFLTPDGVLGPSAADMEFVDSRPIEITESVKDMLEEGIVAELEVNTLELRRRLRLAR